MNVFHGDRRFECGGSYVLVGCLSSSRFPGKHNPKHAPYNTFLSTS